MKQTRAALAFLLLGIPLAGCEVTAEPVVYRPPPPPVVVYRPPPPVYYRPPPPPVYYRPPPPPVYYRPPPPAYYPPPPPRHRHHEDNGVTVIIHSGN